MTLLENPEEWTEYNQLDWMLTGSMQQVFERKQLLVYRISVELAIDVKYACFIFDFEDSMMHFPMNESVSW